MCVCVCLLNSTTVLLSGCFSHRGIGQHVAYNVTKSSHEEKACTSLLYLSPSASISLTRPHSDMCPHNRIVSH